MKGCERFALLASSFIDGELRPAETTLLFSHLVTCEACTRFLTSGIKLQADVSRAEIAAAAGCRPATTPGSSIRGSWKKSPERLIGRLMHSRVSIPGPLAAGVAIALMIIALISRQAPEPSRTQALVHSEHKEFMMTLPTVTLP